MLEGCNDLKANNVNVLNNELQMLEMNSFTVLISNIFFKKHEKKYCVQLFFGFFSV